MPWKNYNADALGIEAAGTERTTTGPLAFPSWLWVRLKDSPHPRIVLTFLMSQLLSCKEEKDFSAYARLVSISPVLVESTVRGMVSFGSLSLGFG
ncbi:hypothetical protein V6N11_003186 [Hibiscus sabdariffa]|uniref:Uncharacterized protein n=1 Tax=Hibiscus sabdariffa TaxID=183260 RepID=A0ABR1ZQ11_9ROSI